MNLPLSKDYVLHFYYKDEGFYYANYETDVLVMPQLRAAIDLALKREIVHEEDYFSLTPLGKGLYKLLS